MSERILPYLAVMSDPFSLSKALEPKSVFDSTLYYSTLA
jgi:hypothetical protein